MNINKLTKSFLALSLFFAWQTSYASTPVKWIGVVQDEAGSHAPDHSPGHELEFVRQSNGDSYDVVSENDELARIHSDKDKKLMVEIEGELTDRFLFWGGNLVIKEFKVIGELEPIEHKVPTSHRQVYISRSLDRR